MPLRCLRHFREDRSENGWEARSRPFVESQTYGKDACLRHPVVPLLDTSGLADTKKAVVSQFDVEAALRRHVAR